MPVKKTEKIEKTEFKKNESIKVFELLIKKEDSEETKKVEGTLKQTNADADLPIRKEPDFTVRPAWFKTKYGYISAYRVKGKYTDIETNQNFEIDNDFEIKEIIDIPEKQ